MSMTKTQKAQLILAARKAYQNSYAPYSKFKVGSAIVTDKGIFTGCNVENVSIGLTVCAERVAITKAISEGAKEIFAVAVSAKTAKHIPPCGMCLQTISEFGSSLTEVILDSKKGNGLSESTTLQDFLPRRFKKKNLISK